MNFSHFSELAVNSAKKCGKRQPWFNQQLVIYLEQKYEILTTKNEIVASRVKQRITYVINDNVIGY